MKLSILLLALILSTANAFMLATRAVRSPGFSLANLQKKKPASPKQKSATPKKKTSTTPVAKKPTFSFGVGKSSVSAATKKKIAAKKPVVAKKKTVTVKKVQKKPINPFGFAKVPGTKQVVKTIATPKANGGYTVTVAAGEGKVPSFMSS